MCTSPLIERRGNALPEYFIFCSEPVFKGAAYGVPARLVKLVCAHGYFLLDDFKEELIQIFRILSHVCSVPHRWLREC